MDKQMMKIIGWIVVGIAVVAGAFTLIILGNASSVDATEEKLAHNTQATNTQMQAPIEVLGAENVSAITDKDTFARIFAETVEALGNDKVTSIQVYANPNDATSAEFYAHANGVWYSCENLGDSAAGYAITVETDPIEGINSFTYEDTSNVDPPHETTQPAEIIDTNQEQTPPATIPDESRWISATDTQTLSGFIDLQAAKDMPVVIGQFMKTKGITFDGAQARVDATTIKQGSKVTFMIDCEGKTLSAEYANGSFGFQLM